MYICIYLVHKYVLNNTIYKYALNIFIQYKYTLKKVTVSLTK